jgi:hypothetical protein
MPRQPHGHWYPRALSRRGTPGKARRNVWRGRYIAAILGTVIKAMLKLSNAGRCTISYGGLGLEIQCVAAYLVASTRELAENIAIRDLDRCPGLFYCTAFEKLLCRRRYGRAPYAEHTRGALVSRLNSRGLLLMGKQQQPAR